jgi:hypothetical protein
MPGTIQLLSARKQLAVLWLLAAAPLTVILIVQTGSGKYGEQPGRAWAWFVPTVIPTLTLVLATLGSHAFQHPDRKVKVDRFFFRLTVGVSAFYLLAVAAVLLGQPFVNGTPLDWFERSSLFLGPLQGITAGVMAIFFESSRGE